MPLRRIKRREEFPVPQLSQRQRTTLLHLLRYEASTQRKREGGKVPSGGVMLSPDEMDTWADKIEADSD